MSIRQRDNTSFKSNRQKINHFQDCRYAMVAQTAKEQIFQKYRKERLNVIIKLGTLKGYVFKGGEYHEAEVVSVRNTDLMLILDNGKEVDPLTLLSK